jgi:hypothetical protein
MELGGSGHWSRHQLLDSAFLVCIFCESNFFYTSFISKNVKLMNKILTPFIYFLDDNIHFSDIKHPMTTTKDFIENFAEQAMACVILIFNYVNA